MSRPKTDLQHPWPVEVGQVSMPTSARYSLAASGDHAYVTDQTGLRVFDASDPAAPVLRGGRTEGGTGVPREGGSRAPRQPDDGSKP